MCTKTEIKEKYFTKPLREVLSAMAEKKIEEISFLKPKTSSEKFNINLTFEDQTRGAMVINEKTGMWDFYFDAELLSSFNQEEYDFLKPRAFSNFSDFMTYMSNLEELYMYGFKKSQMREAFFDYIESMLTSNYEQIMRSHVIGNFHVTGSGMYVYNAKHLYSYPTAVSFIKAIDRDVVFVFNSSLN